MPALKCLLTGHVRATHSRRQPWFVEIPDISTHLSWIPGGNCNFPGLALIVTGSDQISGTFSPLYVRYADIFDDKRIAVR